MSDQRPGDTLGALWLGAAAGLWLPDVDLHLMALLGHRSILTHSLLLPLIAWSRLGSGFGRGLCLGVAIHLAADATSPMTGFALIHLPLVGTTLGAWGSLAWILGNALAGLHLSATARTPLPTLGLAFAYALFHEHALMPFAVFAMGVILLHGRDRAPA